MADQPVGHDALVGLSLGHYRIAEKIGAGGMGEVFRAQDEHLDRPVAIKVLPQGVVSDESSRKRFHKEALALSKLNHPNIATIHDFDTQRGVDFLAMEYIPGTTLSDKLAARPLPEKEIVNLGAQLAEGLTAAHEHGVIHRDLKPGNLRLTDNGRLKILDFGLAKLRLPVTPTAATESLSETQGMAGTLLYMAPEQILGGEIDARTDIHAAGEVLYEMATGQQAFAQVERAQLIGAILHKPPRPPTSLNSKLSPELGRIIGKCLEKEPENRYQSAKELAVDLRLLARDKESGRIAAEAKPVSQLISIVRNKALLAIAGGILMLSVIAGLWHARTRKLPESMRIAPSIAVLPFSDLSPEKNQEYFSDGLAEELLNDLARIPQLRVTARTSSFQFKSKNEDLRSIGQKLNVATILEGSVRKEGRRVRITAQLINAADGFHIWSETYDEELNDVFAVQENIARSVAASLKIELLGTELPAPHETNEEAYNAYLQGQYFYQQRSRDSFEKAADYYEKALKLDSSYAPAWAGLAWLRTRQGDWGYLSTQEAYEKGREAVERALALDKNLADAHAVMGYIHTSYDWDWAAADDSYQRALGREPGNVRAIEGAAMLARALGRFEESLRLLHRLVELNPLDATSQIELAVVARNAGHLDEATTALRKALELNPEVPMAHAQLGSVYLLQSRSQEALAEMELEPDLHWRLFGLALAYQALGRKKEADTSLAELISKYGSIMAFQIAEVYAARNQVDLSFEWLERAYLQHDGGLASLVIDQGLNILRHDPRYTAFLKKVHLPTT